jgi:glycosyltransferase involved in cell wall biosynthesis
MRIGFVSTNDWVPWGGSEELWYQTAKILKAIGIEVGASIARWDPIPPHIQELIDSGVYVDFRDRSQKHRKPLLVRVKNKIERIFQASNSLPTEEISFLNIFKPDLLVISQGNLPEGATWKQSCIDRSIPYVSIVHLVSEFHWFDDRTADLLLNVYQHALCNYFVSCNNHLLAERQLGHLLSNARVVRNPFKVSYQPDFPYPDTEPYFRLACVASLNMLHKGQDILFDILRQEKWKQRPLRLYLYGKGPNERVLRRLKELWSLDMIKVEGFTTDITSIWQQNHGLLMGSRMEGLPLVLVEAMLSQRLAIVPDIGGNAEVIQDNITGFIAKSASVYDIDEAMERAWNRRDEWKLIGEAASRAIRQTIPEDPAKMFAGELVSLLR